MTEAAGTTTNDDPGTSADGGGTGVVAPDEVTTLRSRIGGLDAKVSSLTGTNAELTKKLEAAIKRASDLEAGTVTAEEALQAQLTAKDAELAAERQARAAERLQAKFPETFGLLGDKATGMDDATLAATEARLKGVAASEPTDEEPPVPQVHNESRTSSGGKPAPREKSAADIRAEFVAGPLPPGWGN